MKRNVGLIVMIGLSLSTAALAEEVAQEHRTMASVMAGPTAPTTSGGQSSFVLGARIGTQLGQDQWSKGHLGLVLGSTSLTNTISSLTEVDTATYLMAEYLARQAFGTGLYFGARAGLAFLSANITGGGLNLTGSTSAFSYGPVVGYEVPLTPQVDLDMDASFITRTATSMTIPTLGTLSAPQSQGFMFLGGLNYHF